MRVRIHSVVFAIIYSILFFSSFIFLLVSRTKVGPSIYSNLHPWFIPVYFATILFLATVLLSKAESRLKILFVISFSALTLSLGVIVFDSGPTWDPGVHLGFSRRVYDDVFYDAYGFPWPFSFYAPRDLLSKLYRMFEQTLQYSLSVVFARMFSVDIFWVHSLFIPLSWAIFISVISYSITRILCKDERAALLSSFLGVSILSLMAWGSNPVPQSLGYIFSFFALYLLLDYLLHGKNIFAAVTAAFAASISHSITGLLSFSLVLLAFAFKNYNRTVKYRKLGTLTLIMAFFVSVGILPVSQTLQRFLYPTYYPYFTLSKLSQLPAYDAIWSLIFTRFEGISLKEFVTQGGIVEFLGFLALIIYGLFRSKGDGKQSYRFLLLAYLVLAIDYRILVWFMARVASIRVGPLMSLIAVCLTGVVLNDLVNFLLQAKKQRKGYSVSTKMYHFWLFNFDLRKVMVMTIVILFVAGIVAGPVYTGVDNARLDLSAYELEAAEYIDKTTPERYVVICDKRFVFAGYAVVGIRNPRAFYSYTYDLPEVLELFNRMISDPSPEIMVEASKLNKASIQYFVVGTTSSIGYERSLSEIVKRASRYFELYGVFGDGKNIMIYVFRHRTTPPIPFSSDVSAFHLYNPPSYIVQNDLMRVLVPSNMSLEIRDFWEKLYEGIEFDGTMVDNTPLGNVSKVEYFDPNRDTWVNWNSSGEVSTGFAMKQQFRFRLRFNKVALVAVVERGKPFTQIYWESLDNFSHNITVYLRTAKAEQFVIPGLTDAQNPGSLGSRRYGMYFTLSRNENVTLHYARNYGSYGTALYPYSRKEDSNFQMTYGFFFYDFYIDNEAPLGQWAYVETYLPDITGGGALPPISYSIDNGNTWNSVYWAAEGQWGTKPLKTLNRTEVNWFFTIARRGSEKPSGWMGSEDGIGGEPLLPQNFTDSGGCWNRIILGVYLLGDTNSYDETSFGITEGDQVLVRIGIEKYGLPFDATYIFKDGEDASYGLRNMNDIFLTFSTATINVRGVTFTKKLTSLNITATTEDKIDHITFNVPTDATFSLLAEFTESAAYESLAQLSYNISEGDGKMLLTAKVTSQNDWNRPAIVAICVPSDRSYEGGSFLYERGLSHVLQVAVTDETTETVMIHLK